MSISYSTEDVLVLVLIRLPPKSLGRCKIVSKSWNILISSSEFIRFHLQYQSSIQNKLYALLTNWSHEAHLAEYSINIGQDLELLGCEIQLLYNPYESHAPGMRSMLVGSCNGLLCQILCDGGFNDHIIHGEYEISLCNPLTKSTWFLPKSPLFLKDGTRRSIASYGFGYDDVHDTYKVFLVSVPSHDEYEERRAHHPDAKYEYEVYSLRTNKWIIVSSDLDFHDYFIHRPEDGVLINCALHWLLSNPFGPNQKKNKNYILVFDLRVDKLHTLPLPDAMEECYCAWLSVLNGCLLLSDQTLCFDVESIIDLWMMKDYGLKDSWTRICIRDSPYCLSFDTPLALVEDNHHHHHHKRKLVFHDTSRSNSRGMILLTCDIESHQVVEFPIPPSADLFYSPKQLQFVASLVHPHPPSSCS